MDLMKYVIAAGVSFVIAIIASFMGNLVTGILIFILLFGGYIMWNVLKVINKTPTTTSPVKTESPKVPTKDN
jgi:NADH:ubiquinone oxidoreductase subunit H